MDMGMMITTDGGSSRFSYRNKIWCDDETLSSSIFCSFSIQNLLCSACFFDEPFLVFYKF